MKNFYKNKKVLVTGHTGFKGSWLCMWLLSMGADVYGVSDSTPSIPSNFDLLKLKDKLTDYSFDLLDYARTEELIKNIQPDIIFHMAAQALVRPSYEDPLKTIMVNSIGTTNVLEAIRNSNREVTAIMITSDKVYDNVEWIWGYKEDDIIGGKDPYSASKGMAELSIKTYYESYFKSPQSKVTLGITRAGNVIGGGDWAKDRIVPDCIRSWSENESVDIRNPSATRPWQHVLEPLSGYLYLGYSLSIDKSLHGEAFNFGPSASSNFSVAELINEMKSHWSNVSWNDLSSSDNAMHEAGLLKLNCDKALTYLNWLPALDFSSNVKMTIGWYKAYYENKNMYDFTLDQIKEYEEKAIQLNAYFK